jgi:UDP-N-acetylglucosamine 1-carboxyvinyltransferase
MDKIKIEGGVSLNGEVTISGAKNSALPKDISIMGKLLAHLGMGFHQEDNSIILQSGNITSIEAPYDFVKTMRASVLVLGPLLASTGEAKVSLPGGCAIGARPINLHTVGLEKMGAEITLSDGYIQAKANKLKGATVYLDIPTVTGTENLMMTATLADGETVLENAACEPEVVDLANALISMGAYIRGAGTSVITIKGVPSLKPLNYRIIPDRIETGTFLTAAAITKGNITINRCNPEHIEAVISKLKETGVEIIQEADKLIVKGPERPSSEDIKTMPYPGFPTDMQAQFMTLMALSEGTSLITENIFENRFMHVAELRRMGADIKVEGSTATVKGVKNLKGAPVMATDLRASASLIIAGLAAKGTTAVDRVYHLDRGYERIEKKLESLGARIKRVKE